MVKPLKGVDLVSHSADLRQDGGTPRGPSGAGSAVFPSRGVATPSLDPYGHICTAQTPTTVDASVSLNSLSSNSPRVPSKSMHRRAKGVWGRKQRRAYQRVLSGINYHYKEILRFLTLTMPVDEEKKRELPDAFRALKAYIQRMTVGRLVKEGWLSQRQANFYYAGRKETDTMRFEYFKVETSEGNGVLHIMFYGDYLPVECIRAKWYALTGAYEVDIRAAKTGTYNAKRLAQYVVGQYVVGQEEALRFSYSWGWVYRGFIGAWKGLLNFCRHSLRYKVRDAIWLWRKAMREHIKLGPDGLPVLGPG